MLRDTGAQPRSQTTQFASDPQCSRIGRRIGMLRTSALLADSGFTMLFANHSTANAVTSSAQCAEELQHPRLEDVSQDPSGAIKNDTLKLGMSLMMCWT
eukprot:4180612-Amphidinium_carterae.1